MPSMNADFTDVGSSIFAGPTAISRKKKPVLVLETSEKQLKDLQFQAVADTFRGIAEFDLSASKDGSVNFLKGVLKLGLET